MVTPASWLSESVCVGEQFSFSILHYSELSPLESISPASLSVLFGIDCVSVTFLISNKIPDQSDLRKEGVAGLTV